MLKSNFEFEVLVHGSSTKEYYHKGSYYIEGKEGTRFSLRMRNNSNHRVLFVPTVDGLSIMNGKEASYKSSGYIVSAHDSLTISGWRTSDNNVAEFYFASPKESYAKKMEKGSNLGVLGCAVFKEKEQVKIIEKVIIEKEYIPYPVYPKSDPFWPTHTYYSNSGTNHISLSATSASSINSTSQNLANISSTPTGLGTGFGEDKFSPVVTVEFEKESSPTETFSIYYNTRQNLEELGVEFRKPVYVAPSAFPKEDGYCKRPE